jgi:3-oxoacyl-[acyl-carrier-protein] synthase III
VGDVYLNRPAYVLGRPEPVSGATIDDADDVAAALVADGFTTVHRSAGPCWRAAAEAAAQVLAAAGDALGAGVRPDLSVYCTETWFEAKPAESLSRFVTALGIGASPALVVAGNDCANFVAGLALASGEVERGRSTVLVTTADRMAAGHTRSYQDGLALMSDAAAACLVAGAPLGDAYRLQAVSQRSNSTVDARGRDVVDARTSLRDVRATVDEVLGRAGATVDEVRWLVMNHYRPASAEFVVRAAGLAGIPRARSALGAVGHCYAADAPIVLADLLRGHDVDDGDLVLVLGDGGRSRSALLLDVHVPTGAGDAGDR